MDVKTLSKLVQEHGVVGAGGAGFPTYVKIDERADIILMNCAECEPLLKLHRQLLKKYAYEIIKTFQYIADTVDAGQAIIGIKEEYKETVQVLNQYIGEFPKVSLKLLDSVYPMGDEVVLIYEAVGKVVRPGGIPIEEGVAVFNVETVFNIYQAIERKMPVTDKIVSVVGEVSHPVTVRVPLGTAIEETVALAGDILAEDAVYLIGGPMMGTIKEGKEPVVKTTNAILVLPKDHLLIRMKNRNPSLDLKRAASICCQCEVCSDLCPRNALGHPIEPHKFMRAAANKDFRDTHVFVDTLFCSSCGICEMYACPQSLSPRTLMADYKDGLRRAGIQVPKVMPPAPVKAAREYRKVPEERLKARLGLTSYDKAAPFEEHQVSVNQVKILLGQHIGAPAVGIVKTGDMVEAGQMIARPADGLSVAIHASISGRIIEMNKSYIMIQKIR